MPDHHHKAEQFVNDPINCTICPDPTDSQGNRWTLNQSASNTPGVVKDGTASHSSVDLQSSADANKRVSHENASYGWFTYAGVLNDWSSTSDPPSGHAPLT